MRQYKERRIAVAVHSLFIIIFAAFYDYYTVRPTAVHVAAYAVLQLGGCIIIAFLMPLIDSTLMFFLGDYFAHKQRIKSNDPFNKMITPKRILRFINAMSFGALRFFASVF